MSTPTARRTMTHFLKIFSGSISVLGFGLISALFLHSPVSRAASCDPMPSFQELFKPGYSTCSPSGNCKQDLTWIPFGLDYDCVGSNFCTWSPAAGYDSEFELQKRWCDVSAEANQTRGILWSTLRLKKTVMSWIFQTPLFCSASF